MNHLVRLMIALFLGVTAGIGNWIYLATKTQPLQFLCIKNALKAGQRIDEEDLGSIPVPGDRADLRKTLIPFKNRAVVLGTKAVRDYEAGDVVFTRDLEITPDSSTLDHIGPFELISVGERFKQPAGNADQQQSARGNSVTIAVDAKFSTMTSRLLEAIAISSGAANESNYGERIIAIQVLPSTQQVASTSRLSQFTKGDSSKDVVYQTVSLEGIPNVPAVLLEGDLIRFVSRRN